MANRLKTEKKMMAVAMLCEGNSIRSIERMTGVHRDTIMRLGVRVGQGCTEIMDGMFRNLDSALIEADEHWGFIGAKQKTVKRKNLSPEMGDVWTWVAIDSACEESDTAFAWGWEDAEGEIRYISVLKIPPVVSPREAVQAAIASGTFR